MKTFSDNIVKPEDLAAVSKLAWIAIIMSCITIVPTIVMVALVVAAAVGQ